MTAAVCERCEAIVTKASTMPITPTMTLTTLVKPSPPSCSCEVWISMSAMRVVHGKGVAGDVLEGRQHDVAQRSQVRRGLGHVRHLNDGHAGGVRGAHPVLGVLHGKTRRRVHPEDAGRFQVHLRIGLGSSHLVRPDPVSYTHLRAHE